MCSTVFTGFSKRERSSTLFLCYPNIQMCMHVSMSFLVTAALTVIANDFFYVRVGIRCDVRVPVPSLERLRFHREGNRGICGHRADLLVPWGLPVGGQWENLMYSAWQYPSVEQLPPSLWRWGLVLLNPVFIKRDQEIAFGNQCQRCSGYKLCQEPFLTLK